MNKIRSFFSGLFFYFLLPVIIIALLFEFFSENYDYPSSRKFSGDKLYNPYKNFKNPWYKCNFHAHSFAHMGLTNGSYSPKEVLKKYKELGYSLAVISNYHQINDGNSIFQNLKVYEHGYNILKVHMLAIDANNVDYLDNPFIFTKDHIQNKISGLRKNASIIAIAHPALRNAVTPANFKDLSGYNLLEVFNHYRESIPHWDSALSAGKPVWIISDDDTHDAHKMDETGVCWTMVNSQDSSVKSILNNLKNGNAYGVKGLFAKNLIIPDSIVVKDFILNIYLSNKADSIRFIGQNGKIKSVVKNTSKTNYLFDDEDTYIRTEIFVGHSKLFLNPIIRIENNIIPDNLGIPQIDYLTTWLKRFFILLIILAVIILYSNFLRNKKQVY